jgi:predicted phage terminase large subunit-like protein
VALPLRWVGRGAFRCLFLRREAKYLSDAIDKSRALYPHFGGRLVQSPKIIWTFPSGAQVWLNHCEHESDVANYDSLEFHLVIFEELTHFTEKQYLGIRARIRGTDPDLPRFSRATSNPGGEGHEWVFKRFAAWLDPRHPRPAKPGEIRWFARGEESTAGAPDAISRQFIPATLTDNPFVTADYRAQLGDLDPVRRQQLLEGDWLVKPGAGAYFKRTWIRSWIDFIAESDVVQRVRAWDLGATTDGDWTRGVRMARLRDDSYVVEHVASLRGTPGDVQRFIRSTAEADGQGVKVRLPLDPGQAGLDQQLTYAKLLSGFTAEWKRPTGDKATRFGPFSTQAQAGNVAVKRGAWVDEWVSELEGFPDGPNDDQVDATADALNDLGVPTRIEAPTDNAPDFRSYDDSGGGDDPPFDFAD